MKIGKSRLFPGVRREVYHILAVNGAAYLLSRADGIRYEGRALCIQASVIRLKERMLMAILILSPCCLQVIFGDRAFALRALGEISVLVAQREVRFPGQITLEEHSVLEMHEADASAGQVVATHYVQDGGEDASPQETLSDGAVTIATPELAQHQSIERYIDKYVRAHLVDKRLCTGVLDKLNSNDNNFFALSPSLHTMFDGRNSPGAERLAVRVEQVHPQPGSHAMATLRVIPDSESAREFLAANLREYQVVLDPPAGFKVNVFVTDLALFQACISWKYNKTVKGWAEVGKMHFNRLDNYNFDLLQHRFGDHDLEEE